MIRYIYLRQKLIAFSTLVALDFVLRSLNSLLRLNLNSFCWYKFTNYFRIYQTISENFLKEFYFISEALLNLYCFAKLR